MGWCPWCLRGSGGSFVGSHDDHDSHAPVAVTQQLARLSDRLIVECAADSTVLDSICARTALPAADYADLDWAPHLLDKTAASAGIDADQAQALRRATEGDAEAHPGYAGWYSSYSALTSVNSHETSKISAALEAIDVAVLLRPGVVATAAAGTYFDEPVDYLAEHFENLRAFYRETARRGLGVLLWWD